MPSTGRIRGMGIQTSNRSCVGGSWQGGRRIIVGGIVWGDVYVEGVRQGHNSISGMVTWFISKRIVRKTTNHYIRPNSIQTGDQYHEYARVGLQGGSWQHCRDSDNLLYGFLRLIYMCILFQLGKYHVG